MVVDVGIEISHVDLRLASLLLLVLRAVAGSPTTVARLAKLGVGAHARATIHVLLHLSTAARSSHTRRLAHAPLSLHAAFAVLVVSARSMRRPIQLVVSLGVGDLLAVQ